MNRSGTQDPNNTSIRFTFHTNNPMNLFSKSKDVFENAAKGMYAQPHSGNSINHDINTDFKVQRATFNNKESLMRNNVSS